MYQSDVFYLITVLCCNPSVFGNSVFAGRSGMAAPRLLEGYLFFSIASCGSDSVLRIIVGRLQWNWHIKGAI